MNGEKRVALFYDVPDWAFHNVARNVSKVTDGWIFDLYGRGDWFGRKKVVRSIIEGADLLVFLWRFDLLAFLDCLDKSSWERMAGPDRPALATIVYDHLYDDAETLTDVGDPFVLSDVVGACSERLKAHYNRQPGLPNISFVLPDGVDTDMFQPSDALASEDRPMNIGWVGNSRWAENLTFDLKGRNSVFEPAMRQLRTGGWDVKALVIDAAEKRRPYKHMPALYRQMDILVCTSAIEGTPNPVLEAMASGVCVVSTDVGIVPDVFGPKQSRFIVKHRRSDAFASAIERLLKDPALRQSLRRENLERRDQIDWQTRAWLWQDFFSSAIAEAKSDAGRMRTSVLMARRNNAKSLVERARRLVASNILAYHAYEFARLRAPRLFRYTRRLLTRTCQ